MKELFSPDIQQIQPTRESVFLAQGIDKSSKPSAKINGLFSSALGLFQQLVEPKGMISSISTSDFSRVYSGIGKNENPTKMGRFTGSLLNHSSASCQGRRRNSRSSNFSRRDSRTFVPSLATKGFSHFHCFHSLSIGILSTITLLQRV